MISKLQHARLFITPGGPFVPEHPPLLPSHLEFYFKVTSYILTLLEVLFACEPLL
jgi:hypothetical protein